MLARLLKLFKFCGFNFLYSCQKRILEIKEIEKVANLSRIKLTIDEKSKVSAAS